MNPRARSKKPGKSASLSGGPNEGRALTETTEPNGDRDRDRDRQDLGLRYYVLPDDPLAALNILREAAGLEPWPAEGGEPK